MSNVQGMEEEADRLKSSSKKQASALRALMDKMHQCQTRREERKSSSDKKVQEGQGGKEGKRL